MSEEKIRLDRLEKRMDDAQERAVRAAVERGRQDERIKTLELKQKEFVTKEEFAPRKKLADGLITTIGTAIVLALIGSVLVKFK